MTTDSLPPKTREGSPEAQDTPTDAHGVPTEASDGSVARDRPSEALHESSEALGGPSEELDRSSEPGGASEGSNVFDAGGRRRGRRWFGLRAGASNWLWLALAVIVLDRVTKRLIMQRFDEFEEIVVLPMLNIIRLHNEGAAFSFLSTASGWQRWAFTALGIAVSLGILFWLRRLPARGSGLLAAGLSLVLGGALGNVIDRVAYGHVIDFIRVHYGEWFFPAFNVADSAITVGAVLLILDNLLDFRSAKREGGEAPRSADSGP